MYLMTLLMLLILKLKQDDLACVTPGRISYRQVKYAGANVIHVRKRDTYFITIARVVLVST